MVLCTALTLPVVEEGCLCASFKNARVVVESGENFMRANLPPHGDSFEGGDYVWPLNSNTCSKFIEESLALSGDVLFANPYRFVKVSGFIIGRINIRNVFSLEYSDGMLIGRSQDEPDISILCTREEGLEAIQEFARARD